MAKKPTASDRIKQQLSESMGGQPKDWKRQSKRKFAGVEIREFENQEDGQKAAIIGEGIAEGAEEAKKFVFAVQGNFFGADSPVVHIMPKCMWEAPAEQREELFYPQLPSLLSNARQREESVFEIKTEDSTVLAAAKEASKLGFVWNRDFQENVDPDLTEELAISLVGEKASVSKSQRTVTKAPKKRVKSPEALLKEHIAKATGLGKATNWKCIEDEIIGGERVRKYQFTSKHHTTYVHVFGDTIAQGAEEAGKFSFAVGHDNMDGYFAAIQPTAFLEENISLEDYTKIMPSTKSILGERTFNRIDRHGLRIVAERGDSMQASSAAEFAKGVAELGFVWNKSMQEKVKPGFIGDLEQSGIVSSASLTGRVVDKDGRDNSK